MSNKKKQKTINRGQYGIDYLLGGGESSSGEEITNGIVRADNLLLQGTGANRGYQIWTEKEEKCRSRELLRGGYPDEKAEIIGQCADELLRIAKREEKKETAQLEKLGRIITTSSDVDNYSKMLTDLRFAKTEEEIESIFAKYGFSKDMYPAASEFAKVING